MSLFYYRNNFLNQTELDELIKWLDKQHFISGENLNNKEIPREQIWFQEEGKYFNSMWKQRFDRWKGNYYDDYLFKIQEKVQNELETNEYLNKIVFKEKKHPKMNSCLINKYRSGLDTISAHRDSATSFGEEPLILILSIGETRTLKFTKIIYNQDNPLSSKIDIKNSSMNREFKLENNSIFIMGGRSQKDYTHRIDKEEDKNNIRYSLTFRMFLN